VRFFTCIRISARSDDGVRFDDPRLRTRPLPASCISDRDRALPLLAENFAGFWHEMPALQCKRH
jgi:hypothetical protein